MTRDGVSVLEAFHGLGPGRGSASLVGAILVVVPGGNPLLGQHTRMNMASIGLRGRPGPTKQGWRSGLFQRVCGEVSGAGL